jgi:hypothetical protein
MVRQCLLCRTIYEDETLCEEAKMANVLVLCSSCFVGRIK